MRWGDFEINWKMALTILAVVVFLVTMISGGDDKLLSLGERLLERCGGVDAGDSGGVSR